MSISDTTERERQALAEAARRASRRSYAPYSAFPVGAAVLTGSGRIVSGCNVENAALGLTCCAERVALFKAVSLGERKILALTVYTPTSRPSAPCGSCRQVLQEFASPETLIVALCDGDEELRTTLAELLPLPFSPNLSKD